MIFWVDGTILYLKHKTAIDNLILDLKEELLSENESYIVGFLGLKKLID